MEKKGKAELKKVLKKWKGVRKSENFSIIRDAAKNNLRILNK
ncbi:hypothetical protein BGP_1250 [Beggiatoa sp. PS]|nr:hypothetical protein BGP_1250 [Beggiatoa sp. PS]